MITKIQSYKVFLLICSFNHFIRAASSCTFIEPDLEVSIILKTSSTYCQEMLKLSFLFRRSSNSFMSITPFLSLSAIFMKVYGDTALHFRYVTNSLRFLFPLSVPILWSWTLGILATIKLINSDLEIRPFLSASKRVKNLRISSLVKAGATWRMNLLNYP